MDYERAYKEALERGKRFLTVEGVSPNEEPIEEVKRMLEYIFRELAESEDERIRKEILEYFQQFENEELRGVNISDWIAWIEEQGKKDEEIILLKDKIESLESARIAMQEYHRLELEKQGNQKPATWSEEDEEHLNSIISDIKTDMGAYPRSQEVIDIYNDDISFLQSLKDRVQPQPKNEWSEEDERMLSCAEEAVKAYFSEIGNEGSVIHWLKSLRPQNRWKPSDKQMHYLSWIANIKLGDSVVEQEVSKHLNELYNALKKLKG